jgi:hypothetical protein
MVNKVDEVDELLLKCLPSISESLELSPKLRPFAHRFYPEAYLLALSNRKRSRADTDFNAQELPRLQFVCTCNDLKVVIEVRFARLCKPSVTSFALEGPSFVNRKTVKLVKYASRWVGVEIG